MSSATKLRRTLLVALASLALCAPAAVARPVDLRAEAPTSALSGATDEGAPYVLKHQFDAFPGQTAGRDAALAQERSYSTYGDPVPPRKATTTAATGTGDGITWVPFALGVGALIVALGAGTGLVQARRRATRLAT